MCRSPPSLRAVTSRAAPLGRSRLQEVDGRFDSEQGAHVPLASFAKGCDFSCRSPRSLKIARGGWWFPLRNHNARVGWLLCAPGLALRRWYRPPGAPPRTGQRPAVQEEKELGRLARLIRHGARRRPRSAVRAALAAHIVCACPAALSPMWSPTHPGPARFVLRFAHGSGPPPGEKKAVRSTAPRSAAGAGRRSPGNGLRPRFARLPGALRRLSMPCPGRSPSLAPCPLARARSPPSARAVWAPSSLPEKNSVQVYGRTHDAPGSPSGSAETCHVVNLDFERSKPSHSNMSVETTNPLRSFLPDISRQEGRAGTGGRPHREVCPSQGYKITLDDKAPKSTITTRMTPQLNRQTC